jgi:hypothetical protein
MSVTLGYMFGFTIGGLFVSKCFVFVLYLYIHHPRYSQYRHSSFLERLLCIVLVHAHYVLYFLLQSPGYD